MVIDSEIESKEIERRRNGEDRMEEAIAGMMEETL